MDRLVVRVACRPDPVAISRFGGSRACRELEGTTANGNDRCRKRVDAAAQFLVNLCSSRGNGMPSTRRTVFVAQIRPELRLDPSVVKNVESMR